MDENEAEDEEGETVVQDEYFNHHYADFIVALDEYLSAHIESNPRCILRAIRAIERLYSRGIEGDQLDAAHLLVTIERKLPGLRDYDPELVKNASAALNDTFDKLATLVLQRDLDPADCEIALDIGLQVSLQARPESDLYNRGLALLTTALDQFIWTQHSQEEVIRVLVNLAHDILRDFTVARSNLPAMHVLTDWYKKRSDLLETKSLNEALSIDVVLGCHMSPETLLGRAIYDNIGRRFDSLLSHNWGAAFVLISDIKDHFKATPDDFTPTFKAFVGDLEALLAPRMDCTPAETVPIRQSLPPRRLNADGATLH